MLDPDRITGAAKDLGGKVQGEIGDLTGSTHDSVEGRAREASGKAENLYGQAKDAVRDVAGQAYDTARDAYGSGARRLRIEQVEGRVADHPLASLLVAGFVGFGLGLLIAGRRD